MAGTRHSEGMHIGRKRDDAGGVWIVTGWVLGLILYAGIVLAWHAGFTAAAPFVIIPAVMVVLIGAGNLVSGRRPGRPAPRFNRPDLDPVPIASLRAEDRPAPDGGPEEATTGGTDGAPTGP
jgi:hypothetical protein